MDAGAAVASSTTSRLSCNVSFYTSPAGWFKLAEFILGLLVWALLASGPYWNEPGLQFVMFVAVTSWVLTVILMIIYTLALNVTMLSGAPWGVIEFVFNCFWALMYFIAACVEAATIPNFVSEWVASTVFAFFVTVVYIADTLYAFKSWRGTLPFMSSDTGNNVNT